ncbi:hypothetical protein D9Q98_003116 [Chlorella vulgaris]|uniref:Uncharacterized protein n=1 Tax=Chlorella vulgaris TaxID=3077 RepID=A0A9D4TS48_CHLVU|nr:hypothetical protein D9Q98_003116 [Chlorella vulgaris]
MQAQASHAARAPVVAPQRETSHKKQQGGLPRLVPSAKPPQRQFRTIRENIDKKRIDKLAETNPEVVKQAVSKSDTTSRIEAPPLALLAGGAAVLLGAAAFLANQ